MHDTMISLNIINAKLLIVIVVLFNDRFSLTIVSIDFSMYL